MTSIARLLLCLALLGDAGGLASAAEPAARSGATSTALPPAQPSAPSARDPAEAGRAERLRRAEALSRQGDQAGAIALADQLIAEYEREYPAGGTRWYVARTLAETRAYTADAADAGPATVRVLDVAWADAYFLKAYALVELSAGNDAYKFGKGGQPQSDPKRLAQARTTLERGLELAPYHPRMLAELGNVLQQQRDWKAMLRTFAEAETAAAYAPADEQDLLYGRAKRGIGYALIELGRLDEAEAKYRECLRINPNDEIAARELEYIRQRREKEE